jgi:1,4-alpha-glucan branching enzyme
MEKGYLSILLHAHLPFIRHPEHEQFLEETWFFEAITETYIPLLRVFEGLQSDGIDFRVTMSLTPTLVAMLRDELLQDRYLRHIGRLIELSSKEVERLKWDPRTHRLALDYHWRFTNSRDLFMNKYGKDLTSGFRRLEEAGKLELITCAGTHSFLPLMNANKHAWKAQVKVAVAQHEEVFGRKPKGIWLPECGYDYGIDEILRDEGIGFFFTDTHGVLHASPRPKYGIFAPIICPSGVAVFGRDIESSKQVWSSIEGYPGDHYYRDFYRDIGYDLDYDYIKPYIHPDGFRIHTGIKYHRITGRSDDKDIYDPHLAIEKAATHAGNFMYNRQKQMEHLHGVLGRKPVIVAPYDAELFGHWWYEGPDWLDYLFRKIAFDQDDIKPITPSEYLVENPVNQIATPSPSSWGYKGYNAVWLDSCNDWIYPHLHMATDRMVELARSHSDGNCDELTRRALNQAARELMLAQSSDWAFILKTGTVTGYAVDRLKLHTGIFNRLYEEIRARRIDEAWLSTIEKKDNLLPQMDFRFYL